MPRGQTNVTLDPKGRLTMPTRHRDWVLEQCGGELVIAVDQAICLMIYPLPIWVEIEREINARPSADEETRRLQRVMVGRANEEKMDSAGRLLIPPHLRALLNLHKDLTLVGLGNKFELWNASEWLKYCEGGSLLSKGNPNVQGLSW